MRFDEATRPGTWSRARSNRKHWLSTSQRQPDEFHRALMSATRLTQRARLTSRIGLHYELYADLVSRHASSDRIALRWYDAMQSECSLRYDELDRRVRALDARWRSLGVQTGQHVACVLSMPDGVVACMAALKMGLRLSLVEDGTPQHLCAQLEALSPELVYAPAARSLRASVTALRLDDAAVGTPDSHCHAYLPEEVALVVDCRLDPEGTAPREVSAKVIYEGALRLCASHLCLAAGDVLAAPELDLRQHQPALLFACMLAGATYLHLTEEQLRRNPALLTKLPLAVLGISPTIQAIAHELDGEELKVDQWFHDPSVGVDFGAFRTLVEELGLATVAGANLVIDARAGGAVLCSRRRPGGEHLAHLMHVLPCPGRPWLLGELDGSGEATVADHGLLLDVVGGKAATTPGILISRVGDDEYLFAGYLEPRRGGRHFPVTTLRRSLEGLALPQHTCVLAVPAGGTALRHRFVLLVFTGPLDDAARAAREALLREHIATHLGSSYLPDRIELLPLWPKLDDDGRVDRAWCESMYASGWLRQKARQPVQHALAAARRECFAAELEARALEGARSGA